MLTLITQNNAAYYLMLSQGRTVNVLLGTHQHHDSSCQLNTVTVNNFAYSTDTSCSQRTNDVFAVHTTSASHTPYSSSWGMEHAAHMLRWSMLPSDIKWSRLILIMVGGVVDGYAIDCLLAQRDCDTRACHLAGCNISAKTDTVSEGRTITQS